MDDLGKIVFNVELDSTKRKLISEMKSLKSTLECEINRLESESNYKPNDLGVLQYSGVSIDILCGKLGVLYRMKEIIESVNK